MLAVLIEFRLQTARKLKPMHRPRICKIESFKCLGNASHIWQMEVDVNTSTYSHLYRTCRAVQRSRAHKEGSVGWVQHNNNVRETCWIARGFTWLAFSRIRRP